MLKSLFRCARIRLAESMHRSVHRSLTWGHVPIVAEYHPTQGDKCWFVVKGDGGGVYEATVEEAPRKVVLLVLNLLIAGG